MNHSEDKEQLHARPCDGCARRRARWYCGADDAFLCQRCDASVHSANPLARRHERLRLKTSSFSAELKLDITPAWHHGITRKARTPRPKPVCAVVKSEPLVPDLETVSADENNTEEDQLLLYCVPVLDHSARSEKPFADSNNNHVCVDHEDDAELTEFAADMERLLGPGLDEDALCMQGLGFLDLKDESNHEIKMEVEDDHEKMAREDHVELSGESLEPNLIDCGSAQDETDDQKVNECLHGKKLILRLDYEKVMDAWSSCNGLSPWGDGERPVINLDRCWPEFMMEGMGGGGGGGEMGQVGGGDGGREARVTRYREKRRTRLFAKKIRYEVRKLNAEKRPRMKGRFVKRVSSY